MLIETREYKSGEGVEVEENNKKKERKEYTKRDIREMSGARKPASFSRGSAEKRTHRLVY